MKISPKTNNLIVAVCTTVVTIVSSILMFNILYPLNDDIMIEALISGKYTGQPEFMTYYFSVPLAFIISLLYRITASIPWLGIFFVGVISFCFFLLVNRLLNIAENYESNRFSSKSIFILAIITVYLMLIMPNLVLLHYTLIAAITGASAIFLTISSDCSGEAKSSALKANIPSLILLLLSYLIRENVFYMLLPFFLSAVIFKILEDNIKNFFKYIILLSAIILAFILCFGINKGCYLQKDWHDYLEYNTARTELYDFVNIQNSDSAKEYYDSQNISTNDYDLYRSYNIMLADNNTEILNKFISYKNINDKDNLSKLKDALYMYKESLFSKDQYAPFNYIVILLYILLLIVINRSNNKYQFLSLIATFVARTTVWIYIFWQGRFPARITDSLFLIEIFLLLGLLTNYSAKLKRLSFSNFITSLTIICLLAGATHTVNAFPAQYKLAVKNNDNSNLLYDYFKEHPNNNYYIDTYTTVNRTEYVFRDYNSNYSNYMIMGGWMTANPLTDKRLSLQGYNSVKDALLTGDNSYLVLKDNLFNGIVADDFRVWLNCDLILEDIITSDEDTYWIYKTSNYQ